MTSICLNMIVKNEAARIERCLNSVAPHISCFAIMDTGSTDGTPEMIRDFFGTRNVPGRVWEGPFINYRDARNLALAGAHELRSKFGWEYLLLVDADMELIAPDGLGLLQSAGYQMLQKSGGLGYWNARLIKHDNGCRYVCPTHEYLDTAFWPERLQGAWFVDWADGSNRPGKIERDIAMLEGELAKNPADGRCWFYLGSSYRELGQFQKAIDAYQQRITLGGWIEETYISMLYASRCLRALGR